MGSYGTQAQQKSSFNDKKEDFLKKNMYIVLILRAQGILQFQCW
jgi:hypothetical protein